jgi:ABC-type transporter Mla subunit MlaD
MTGEEMERAIEFLLKNQASFDARLEESKRQLDSYADTQAELMRVVTRTFEAQNRINEEFRRGHEELRHGHAELREELHRGYEELRRGQENLQRSQDAAWAAIRQTEKTVDRLVETVRRHLEGGSGNSGG